MVIFFDIVSWICLVVGPIFCIIGAVGLLRLPDFYARTHAAGITDTLGAGLIFLGLIIDSGFTLVSLKLGMIMLLLLLTSPTTAHAIAKAARISGIHPQTGNDQPN